MKLGVADEEERSSLGRGIGIVSPDSRGARYGGHAALLRKFLTLTFTLWGRGGLPEIRGRDVRCPITLVGKG